MNKKPSFIILQEEQFSADYYGNENYLSELGGIYDQGNVDDVGLIDWTYQFKVQVTNQENETEIFTIAFQPIDRTDKMATYTGYDIDCAALYGYDDDESEKLEKFCFYDRSVIDALHKIAENEAKEELKRLINLKNS